MSPIEVDLKLAKETRNNMSEALTDAKTQWELRQMNNQTSTEPDELSHSLMKGTKSSDARGMDRSTIEAQEELLRRTINARKALSNVNADAKSEWELRQSNNRGKTEPDELSQSLMKGTKISHTRETERSTIEAQEALLRRNINARKALSEAASQASDL